MKHVRILYAEDDETLAFLTRDNLQERGYEVAHYSDGNACLAAFRKHKFDLCILDILMPGMDGFAVAAAIRKANNHIPILFLTAKTLQEDKLTGLRLGADDYLVKPFSMEELVLKIEVFLRRSVTTSTATRQSVYQIGQSRFDAVNYTLEKETGIQQLTQREAALLQYFLDQPGLVIRREQILTDIWGQDDYFYGRSLDVFVSRLRKMLASEPEWKIETIHGVGFRLLKP